MILKDLFEDIFTPEFEQEAKVEYTLAQLAGRALKMKKDAEMSFREIAWEMGGMRLSSVQRVMAGGNTTIKMLVLIADACGYDVDIQFVKRSS